jgi:hypothetical protein
VMITPGVISSGRTQILSMLKSFLSISTVVRGGATMYTA